MHICIPSKISYPSSLPPHPWLNNKALSLIKRRNSIFRAAKRSGSSSLLSLYHSARNKVVSYLRKLKSHFLKSLSSNPQSFWPKVNKLRKKHTTIPLEYQHTYMYKYTCKYCEYMYTNSDQYHTVQS